MKLEKKFSIRTDASNDIGFGHVMRCLTLAKALIHVGAYVEFITRSHEGNLIKYIERKGIRVHTIDNSEISTSMKYEDQYASWLKVTQKRDAEDTIKVLSNSRPHWLIVDHYSLDELWEKKIHPFVEKIMVIDDLANRKHHCNLLLDMTVNRSKGDYYLKTIADCNILVGAKYSLLRKQFKLARSAALLRRKNTTDVNRILVSLGGHDALNMTSWVLKIIETANIDSEIVLDVIIDSENHQVDSIKKHIGISRNKILLHHNVENMADLMVGADLCIGACGISTWERSCLGLPTIVIVTEENQMDNAQNMQNLDSIINLGWYQNIDEVDFIRILNKTVLDQEKRFLLSKKSSEVSDGDGVNHVLKEIIYAD